jgi:hypothetical protein
MGVLLCNTARASVVLYSVQSVMLLALLPLQLLLVLQ